jgi:nucleoside-diphosphate-sugar epimerase
MTQTVTVLGFNGRVGQAISRAFVDAGWNVVGMGRHNSAALTGVTFVQGDARNPEDIRLAVRGADVVVNALNPKYDQWDKGRYEALTASVIEGLKGFGKTVLFAGNIYNYSADVTELTPDTPQEPARDKGEIRMRIEAMMAAAAKAGEFQFVVVRAPDFYGPYAHETNFDMALLTRLKAGIVYYPGTLSIGHSWAYLPDLGKAFVKVAEARKTLGTVDSLHFAGHFATGNQLVEIVRDALPMPVKVKPMPWGLMRMMGIFVPVVREVLKMRYLWEVPHRLVDPRMAALLGPDFGTPMREAVTATTLSYLPEGQD